MTVSNSIIAKNDGGGTPDVYAGADRTFTSGGNNRLTQGGYGFVHNQNGDYIGPVDYIVTGVADTYDGSSDPVVMSLRDAIHLANTAPGAQEIWLPAWNFVLTRDRETFGDETGTDMNVRFGDLDIDESLTIRGIAGSTSVAWRTGIVDAVFDLLGDYDGDGITTSDSGNVDSNDYSTWRYYSLHPELGDLRADGDDDGDVDDADYTVWSRNFGNTLVLKDVMVS